MNAHRCRRCVPSEPRGEDRAAHAAAGVSRRRRSARRFLEFIEWTIPGITVAFMPKCPACFAAYIALGTGLGMSVTAATYLRIVLMVLCFASLTYLAATRARRWLTRCGPAPHQTV